jgi:hypothetical protein
LNKGVAGLLNLAYIVARIRVCGEFAHEAVIKLESLKRFLWLVIKVSFHGVIVALHCSPRQVVQNSGTY